MPTRGAVVLLTHGRVALIGRRRPGEDPFFVFPGGKAEPGETPAGAAVREAHEELGVHVRLRRLLAVEAYRGSARHYFLADIVGGVFGTGAGPEMSSAADSGRGSYTPVWLPAERLAALPVYPRRLAALIAAAALPAEPVHFVDDSPGDPRVSRDVAGPAGPA